MKWLLSHLLASLPLNTGTQITASTELQPGTPQYQDKQPAPSLTSAEVIRYQWRTEEGFDIPDPMYQQWMESVGARSATVVASQDAAGEAVAKSSCQSGECGHSRARQWIGCDHCTRWYHCLCVGIRPKKAEGLAYTCPSCSPDQ